MSVKNKASNQKNTREPRPKKDTDATELYNRGLEDDYRARQWMSGDRFDQRDEHYNRRDMYDSGNRYDDRDRFDDWREQRQRHPEDNMRRGYHVEGVDGNRNPARGEGYYGYGNQRSRDFRYPEERFDDEERFYRDRGYSRDMYARNDRSPRWDNRRYDDRGYGGGGYPYDERTGYPYDERTNYDQRYHRNDYNDAFHDRQHFHEGDYRDQEWHRRNEPSQHKQRVVGRRMYGNHPSGRYGNYGDDTMHGNMGGGTWQGNNEYQVGGGTGYQPSDAGTYGANTEGQQRWEDDEPGKAGSKKATSTPKSRSRQTTGKRNKNSG